MATRSSMPYQQPPYQSTVNEPMVVRPVVITSSSGIGNFEGSHPRKCCLFFGFFGIALLIVWVLVYTTDDGYSRRSLSSVGLPLIGIFVVLFSIIACCCFFGVCVVDKNVSEIPESAQPVSEPFTQHQMNQGAIQNAGPDYDQQPAFAPPAYSSLEGPNTASAPQFSWSDMASNAQSVPPPLFAPPPYKES